MEQSAFQSTSVFRIYLVSYEKYLENILFFRILSQNSMYLACIVLLLVFRVRVVHVLGGMDEVTMWGDWVGMYDLGMVKMSWPSLGYICGVRMVSGMGGMKAECIT